MKLKKIYIYISFIIFSLTNITNSYSIEPDVFVQSTVNRASQVLSDSLSRDQKIEKLKAIAAETVDIKRIVMYTLGALRKTLKENQKKNMKHFLENTS